MSYNLSDPIDIYNNPTFECDCVLKKHVAGYFRFCQSFLKMLGSANKHFIRIFFTVLLAAAVLKFVLHSRHINVFFSVLCLWEFLVNTSIQYGTQLLKPVGQLGGTY